MLTTKNENDEIITDPNHIAFTNPFRYRGYVYDPETELYYLQSRYYDPLTGRFLNADSPDYTDTDSGSPLSTNMFAYCENNAVNAQDYNGTKRLKAPKTFEKCIEKMYNKKQFGNKKIRIKINNNTIKIIAAFNLKGDLKNKKINGKYYNTLFYQGIEEYWSVEPLKFKVNTYNKDYHIKLKTYAIQRQLDSIEVDTNNDLGISNVKRGLFGWSISNYGHMTLFRGDKRNPNPLYTEDQFKRVVAHEFGHIMGLDDLYLDSIPANIKSKYSPLDNPSFMMEQFSAPHINNFDLKRVLLSFIKNKSQRWF